MNRKKIVAGNWKMNMNYDEGISLIKDCIALSNATQFEVEILFATPAIHLKTASELVAETPNMHVAAQNCHWEMNGAFTGEISLPMIKSCGASYVIIGHSERREYNRETNQELALKINAAIKESITPIFCCGESLELRESGEYFNWIKTQLYESLFQLTFDEISKVVIAYEPIWAIGTGKTASATQAQEIHAYIRQLISEKYSSAVASSIPILYGGSCKPSNAKEIFSQPDVDGGLIGGASLVATDFIAIANSF